MSLLRSVPAALLALVLYSNLAAQTGDTPLSPPIYRASMPDKARVQAAVRLGDAILAVWGSGENMGARDYGVLYWQIVRDGKALGTPRKISRSVLVDGYLRVFALKDRFAVVWNDERSMTGSAYIQLIALDETLGEEHVMLHDRPIRGLMLARLGNAMTLFWNDDRDGGTVYSRDIAEDGTLGARTENRGRGVLEQSIVPAGIPGYTMIPRGYQAPMLFDESGREIAPGSWGRKFATPFHLNDDGSVATLTHDTVLFFRAMLDTVPARKSIVPIASGALDGSQVLSRGEDGRLQLSYAVGGENIAGYGEEIAMRLVRSVESAGGSFGTPELLRRFTVARPDRNCQTIAIDSIHPERSRIAANAYQVEIGFQGAAIYQCNGTYSALPLSSSLRYFIRGGSVLTDSLPGTVDSGDYVRITRADGFDSSVVLVESGSGIVRLAARSAVWAEAFPQISPAIKVVGGELLMGWMSVEEKDTVARLARWEYGAREPATTFSTMNLASTAGEGSGMTPLLWNSSIRSMEGQFLLERRSRWKQPEDSSQERRLEVFAPTLEGWKPLLATNPVVSGSLSPVLGTAAFDPLTGETLLGVRHVPATGIAPTDVIAFDSLYRPVWRLDSLLIDQRETVSSIIPVKSNDVMVATSSHIVRFKDGALLRHHQPPQVPSSYKRLLGPYFLRWDTYPEDPWDAAKDPFMLALTPFTLEGEMIKSRSYILKSTPITDPFITQNPADSTVIILLGGTQGVRLIAVDRELRIRSGPVYVSDSGHRAARPSGVFRGDTLFVVWEDYRYGFPIIYGRAVTWERPVASAGEMPGAAAGAMTLRPLPANERLLVLFPNPLHSGSTLEIADITGVVRITLPVEEGTAEREIDLRALPAGTYLARLRTASGGATVQPFVIVR